MMSTPVTPGPLKLKPADGLILLFACLVTIWLYWSFWSLNARPGDAQTLVIHIADQPAKEYPLNKDQIIDVRGALGSSLVEIRQGKARFIHSQCRNQFCVFHGWLTIPGDTTACLPNQISIRLQGKLKQFDSINY